MRPIQTTGGKDLLLVVCMGLMFYLRYARFVFTSSCLYGSHVLFTLFSVRLYLQLFVWVSCLIYVMLGSSLPPVVCMGLMSYLRYARFVFTSSCLYGSYLRYLCLVTYSGVTCCVVFWFCFSSSCVPRI
jgi:hypothetical protein